MGTDIHGVVQVGWKVPGEEPDSFVMRWKTTERILDDRNYALFAVLAGVRNGYGFAGIPTHEPVQVIAEPRGLPEDFPLVDGEAHEYSNGGCTEDVREWMGDHSFSWVMLEEALGYPWDAPLACCGVVTREFFLGWDMTTRPSRFSGDVAGPGIRVVDQDGWDHIEGEWSHIRVYWTESRVGDRCEVFLRWLLYLQARYADSYAVRLVFGFDS